MRPSCAGTVVDAHSDRACPAHDLIEDRPSRVTDVGELATRQLPQPCQAGVVENLTHQRPVAADDKTSGYAGRHDPHEVLRHRPDEFVGLVAPSPREAPLRPATGRRARLDVSGADLVRNESRPVDVRNGIPTAPDQDERKVRGLEPRDPDDPLGTIGVGGVKALAPRVETLGRDLNDSGHHNVEW